MQLISFDSVHPSSRNDVFWKDIRYVIPALGSDLKKNSGYNYEWWFLIVDVIHWILLIDWTSFMYEAATLAEGANCKLLASKDVWEDDV